MNEFIIDIKNLVVKHWGKLIIIFLLGSIILNFGDAIDGFNQGQKEAMQKGSSK